MSRDLYSILVRRVRRHTTRLAGALLLTTVATTDAHAEPAVDVGPNLWRSTPICRQLDADIGRLFVQTLTTARSVLVSYATPDGERLLPEVLASGATWSILRVSGPTRVCAVAWDLEPHSGLDLRLKALAGDGRTVADPIEIDPDGTVADPIEIDPDGLRVARPSLW